MTLYERNSREIFRECKNEMTLLTTYFHQKPYVRYFFIEHKVYFIIIISLISEFIVAAWVALTTGYCVLEEEKCAMFA